MIFLNILFESLMSFFACISFAILFNAPKKELLYCGISGAIGWFFYALLSLFITPTMATLVAAVFVTAFSRFASYHRQAPSTLYHIPGIMPLVPGTAVYNTMTAALGGMILETYSNILLGLKLAGAIGAGSILMLALPYSFFEIIPKRMKKIKKTTLKR
ncbi:threonine/serine exporter family protein [Anaerotignum sp. MB30-C6]|uniref:threonine/serine exporter family protein n=1 Tax=Anaerotignum sp. MB30-C6 TaxID=3070814 RepID=UPI0027DC3C3A|nr:threonine/serine exporter family protein [Anaerotignum sp. MB30-C6]WMI81231.1 threonine/serine exporter family protein [Anaerotignum sp. MB30-C6]